MMAGLAGRFPRCGYLPAGALLAGAFGRWNGGDIVRVRGTVKGKSIAVDAPLDLPEGQRVEVEVHPVMSEPAAEQERAAEMARWQGMTEEEFEEVIATHPKFEHIRRADEMRKALLERWGGPLNLATQFIREDRER